MRLKAKDYNELAICLKFLYGEQLNHFKIDIVESDNGKLNYEVLVPVDEKTFCIFKKKYEILVSK